MPNEILLSESDIKSMWVDGILNDTAYVSLALRLSDEYSSAREFDTPKFISDWEVPIEDEEGNPIKIKSLKPKSIRDTIEKLVGLGLLRTKQQTTLQVTW